MVVAETSPLSDLCVWQCWKKCRHLFCSLSFSHAPTSFHTNRLVCISYCVSYGENVGIWQNVVFPWQNKKRQVLVLFIWSFTDYFPKVFCVVFFFSDCCDDSVGDVWQTVLDALKLVVTCIHVGLWGSGLCKREAVPFHICTHRDDVSSWFWWNGTGTVVLCFLKLMNRHVRAGHFVWRLQEEQDT